MARNETARRAREHAEADYGFGGIGYGECRRLLKKCADEIDRLETKLQRITAAVEAAKTDDE